MSVRSKTNETWLVSHGGATRRPLRSDHAGSISQRQAEPFARCFSVRRLSAATALLCVMLLAAAGHLGAQDVAPPEPQLRSDQRFLRGRIETLDRELETYERDRLRAPTPDPLTGVPRRREDPLAERKQLEHRTLQDRERLIQQDLRRQPLDRNIRRGR